MSIVHQTIPVEKVLEAVSEMDPSEATVAIVAFDLNPTRGTECGTAHNVLKSVARHFRVVAYVDSRHESDIRNFDYGPNVRFVFARVPMKSYRHLCRLRLYNLANLLFVRECRPVLLRDIKEHNIRLVHFVTPMGIHSFNRLYKDLSVPFLVGPLGGGLRTPRGFFPVFGLAETASNSLRGLFYSLVRWNLFFRRYVSRAALIILGTEDSLRFIPKTARARVRILFEPAIDMNAIPPRRARPEREWIQLVFAGRLVPTKGLRLLVDAMKTLQGRRGDLVARIRVMVIGDGKERKSLEERIARYQLSSVFAFKGAVARKQVFELLAESDIFCLPTIREPGGWAVLEAMACGLPVVTSDYGGPKYSVDEATGIKISVAGYKQYVQDLSVAIERLVEDPSLRQSLGEKARQRVGEEFSLVRLEEKMIGLYQEVLRES